MIFQPGGVAAPITYASSTQINCLVPYEILGGGSIQVQVKYLGQNSNAMTLQYAASQPGIFTATGTGSGLASVLQYDAQGNYQGQNSSSNPAKAGWYFTFYVTGEGMIPSPAVTGKVTSTATVIPLLGPPTCPDRQPALHRRLFCGSQRLRIGNHASQCDRAGRGPHRSGRTPHPLHERHQHPVRSSHLHQLGGADRRSAHRR